MPVERDLWWKEKENTNQRPVSLQTSPWMWGIKRRATKLCFKSHPTLNLTIILFVLVFTLHNLWFKHTLFVWRYSQVHDLLLFGKLTLILKFVWLTVCLLSLLHHHYPGSYFATCLWVGGQTPSMVAGPSPLQTKVVVLAFSCVTFYLSFPVCLIHRIFQKPVRKQFIHIILHILYIQL